MRRPSPAARHSKSATKSLALVCHQLRFKTRGMLFKANKTVDLRSINSTNPSLYTLNLFEKHIGSAAMARLRKIAISRQSKHGAGDKVPLPFKDVCDALERFKDFCVNHPDTVVVLRFGHVADIDSKTWRRRCFALKEIVRGKESLPDLLGGNNDGVRETKRRLGGAVAELRGLPASLRFSVLRANPSAEVVETKESLAEGGEMNLAVKRCARDLCEDGI